MATSVTLYSHFALSPDMALEFELLCKRDRLQQEIARYRVHHGAWPALVNHTLPQLTHTTNAQGEIGQGPDFGYGPYFQDGIPENPLAPDKIQARLVAAPRVVPPTEPEGNTGWLYDPTTGGIWANTAGQMK